MAQYVFARLQRRLNNEAPYGRMRRYVDDLHVVAAEQLAVVLVNIGVRIELVPPCDGRRQVEITEGDNMVAGRSVCRQMVLGNAAAADQTNTVVAADGVLRQVDEFGWGRGRHGTTT